MFKTLNDGQAWIESIYRFSDKYDLSRMEKAAQRLGNPQNHFKSIHIGGTNGKGSTLTYLKYLFLEAGYTVGTYTSPYVVRFNERITLNKDEISDDLLLDYINTVYTLHQDYLEEENDQISFFELVTLISFLYFKDTQPDIALIEVGLGGTLDATNIIHPICSVITNIGSDHMHILGPTLYDVATQKLGIVKPNAPLFSGHHQRDLDVLFDSVTKKNNSHYIHAKAYPLTELSLGMPSQFMFLDTKYTLNMAGVHQVENAQLALIVADYLENNLSYTFPINAKQKAIKDAFWPGRFEVFGNVVIDGAHNIEGLTSCFDTVKKYYPNKIIHSLFTVMEDKDYQPMLDLLSQNTDKIVFTKIPHPRCEKASVLLRKTPHKNATAVKDFNKAFHRALPNNDQEVLIVTGSLYFISEIRKILKSQ